MLMMLERLLRACATKRVIEAEEIGVVIKVACSIGVCAGCP